MPLFNGAFGYGGHGINTLPPQYPTAAQCGPDGMPAQYPADPCAFLRTACLPPKATKPASQNMLSLIGLGALALLVTFPLSDAVMLIRDFNFVFWGGSWVPTTVIMALLSVLIIYVMVIGTRASEGPVREVAGVVTAFSMLLGGTLSGLNYLYHYHHVFWSKATGHGGHGVNHGLISGVSLMSGTVIAVLALIVVFIAVMEFGGVTESYSSRIASIAAMIAGPLCLLTGMTLTSLNYVYSGSASMPTAVMVSLAVVLVAYVVMTFKRGVQGRTGRQLASVAATFCLFVGLTLGLASLYFFHREVPIADALKYDCRGNIATQDAAQHYSSLLKLRETPACAQKMSIVECAGYTTVAPPEYTTYFQTLEKEFHCSGFCHDGAQPKTSALETEAEEEEDSSAFCQTKVTVKDASSLLQTKVDVDAPGPEMLSLESVEATVSKALPASWFKQDQAETTQTSAQQAAGAKAAPMPYTTTQPTPVIQDFVPDTTTAAAATTEASAAAAAAAAAPAVAAASQGVPQASHLPPALFSKNAYKSSCDAAASRALTFSVIGTSKVWCWMSMALIGTSAALSLSVGNLLQ